MDDALRGRGQFSFGLRLGEGSQILFQVTALLKGVDDVVAHRLNYSIGSRKIS